MIYAYIKNECCKRVIAVKPGELIGRDETPVSKHGDYHSWGIGKRRTLEIMRDGRETLYMMYCAKAVASLMGWS